MNFFSRLGKGNNLYFGYTGFVMVEYLQND